MTPQPLWWDGEPARRTRPALTAGLTADVCVVGAGYTGLWTAYYLSLLGPGLDIVVLDSEHVGFGASGRNGGWVSALYPVGPSTLARHHSPDEVRDLGAALRESVREIGRVAAEEGIDCGFARGGTVVAARSPAQVRRAQDAVAESDRWGLGTRWLDERAARARVDAVGTLGATYNPHCARVHPFRLVRGLAQAVERRGVRILEGTRVVDASRGLVRTAEGPVVRARHVIRATEAWTARLPGLRRRVAPVYSLVVATEPLPEASWRQIGLGQRETFSDHRHVIVYGQRTQDERLVFGGRGAPYHLGSGIKPEFDEEPGVFAMLRATVREMFPVLESALFTHAWGGPLGVPRDWHPSVAHDLASGVGRAGGYVGDGVALSNIAGRTLTDLILTRRTRLTRLPIVGHRSPDWEPEPLRWIGVNAGLRLAGLADREELLTGRPAVLGKGLALLTGH